MPVVRLLLIALLLAPAASVAASTSAGADVYCRTYVWRVGNRTCWRRVCWQMPQPQYFYRPSPEADWNYSNESRSTSNWNYSHTEPSSDDDDARQPSYERSYTPHAVAWQMPPLPEVSPEFLFIAALIGVGIFLGRALSFARAVAWQRRADRIHERTLSARALERRMRQDAEAADQLIARYTDAAYRRGGSY